MPSTTSMQTGSDAERPHLAPHVRLRFDPARKRHVLLTPEAVTVLNDTGAAILELCDGERTVAEILTELRARYDRVADDEVRAFLAGLKAKRRVETRVSAPEASGGQSRG
jgi:pyrroloquinoline quinone biosynthesis protein D